MSSLNGMTINTGCTGLTPTAGSALTLGRISSDNNGVVVAASSEAFNVRTNITFRSKKEKLQPDGTWSKMKRQVALSKPKVLANGTVSFSVVRFEVEAHPEVTDAELVGLIVMAAQCYTDSDCADFRTAGSLA